MFQTIGNYAHDFDGKVFVLVIMAQNHYYEKDIIDITTCRALY